MLKNHLAIALRRLRRQPGYTFINVFGLALGMACCLLIGLYVQDELSFDRFHKKADRLFTLSQNGGSFGPGLSTPYPLASTLEATMPEIEHAVRTTWGSGMSVVRDDPALENEQTVLLTEPAFFHMFTFQAVAGDPAAALDRPDGIVITESAASTFFGDENPIGRTLRIPRYGEERTFMIGAVVQDVPNNTTIGFDVVAPLTAMGEEYRREDSWGASMFRTYALAARPMPASALDERLAAAITAHLRNTESERDPPKIKAIPLTSVYLSDLYSAGGGFKGQSKYLYIFGSVALFVLLIAAVNYVNLVTAQAARRAREVGVRKTLGAGHGQLVRQFLGESVLLSLAALVAALVVTGLALSAFNRLFEKNLTMGVGEYGFALAILCVFVLLVAIAASAYPALVLSSFRPTAVLRGSVGAGGWNRGRLVRNGLVVLQFTASVVLITGTAVIFRQLDFVQNRDLGFDGEQVAVMTLPGSLSASARDALKSEVQSHADVLAASVANGLPSRFQVTFAEQAGNLSADARTDEESVQIKPAVVDPNFIGTLGISIVAGRDFSSTSPADQTRAYVLNESAAHALGWSADEAVGKPFRFPPEDNVPDGEVIGVVENFHIASLHNAIDPIVLQLREDDSWSTSYALIAKLAPDGIRGALDHLERQFERAAPGGTFEYEFLDDRFDAMYRTEQRLGRIFAAFATLAVLIACMGLFGLAAFTAQRRTKEIGIRKVLGASVSNIVALLSKDFVALVAVAFAIAVPVANVLMNRWLEEFAYRIEVGPGNFLLVAALALAIAIATVSYQSIKAALADPARSLRYE